MPTTYVWNGSVSTAFATAGNWTPSGPPVTGDTAVFNQNATSNALAGSDQSAVLLAVLNIYQGYTLTIGSKATPLQVGCTLLQGGLLVDSGASSSGPSEVIIDTGTNQNTTVIYNTGITTPSAGLENYRLKGTHASNAIHVLNGIVGLATNADSDVATYATVQVSGGRVNIADGATLTTVTVSNSAQLQMFAGCTTLTMNGNCRVATFGDYAVTTGTINGGYWTCNHRKSSGDSITTLNRNGGTIDTSGDPRSLTITTYNEANGTFKAFSATQVTYTTTAQSNGTYLTRTVSLN